MKSSCKTIQTLPHFSDHATLFFPCEAFNRNISVSTNSQIEVSVTLYTLKPRYNEPGYSEFRDIVN